MTQPHIPTETTATPAYAGLTPLDFNLVLEGGAMRGVFTAGVLDFLMEQGVFARTVLGTSAGALNGLNYVAGAIGRTALINVKYCTDWRYLSMRNLVRTGSALGVDLMYHEIPDVLEPFDYDAFDHSPSQLVSVASNIDLGEADYHRYNDMRAELDYLIATASMPMVSKTVEVDGLRLLDGGVCDSVPLLASMLDGAEKHVVVLTQHDGYKKKPNKLLALARTRYGDCPYFIDRIANRHFEYNRTYRWIKRLEHEGKIFVFRPAEPVTVAQMEDDPAKLLDLYSKGYEQALRGWPGLQRYLNL